MPLFSDARLTATSASHGASQPVEQTAAPRLPEMPATVKTALRTLLLSTSDVYGTEGYKRKLRFNSHAGNLLWSPPAGFADPNVADK